MGGVSTGPNGLNVELNLVPFIDLLSALVLFLLLTAVWVHISAIPSNIDAKGATQIVSTTSNLLSIRLSEKGHEITYPTSLQSAGLTGLIPKIGPKAYDLPKVAALATQVAKLTKDSGGTLPTTAVSADDSVDYGEVVHTVDMVRENGIEGVALSTN